MRTPQDLPRRLPRASRRTRVLLVVAVVVIIVLIASLRGLANFWTDYLWFQSVGFTSVFKGVLLTKVVLSIVFIAIFFAMMMVSLTLADRYAPAEVDPATTNDLVLRYRDFSYSRGVRIRVIVSVVFAVLGGIGADRQWNHWDLFRYHLNFGIKDPQFHKDVGFYVFQLPFIRFLISWAFEAVVVVLIVTAVVQYLNGGISPQSPGHRVSSAVKVQLSVLLAVLAVIKAVGYYYDRLGLVLSRSHVVDGATATSVHADAPAKVLLIFIALVSAGLFVANIRQRGWVLPAVGVALWALVSVLVGAVYPALYQSVRVKPSELTRETPYIQRNIQATQSAFGLDHVTTPAGYNYSSTINESEVVGNSPQAQVNRQTLANVRLLDPAVNLLNTFNRFQALRSYYSFNDLDLDRYLLNVNGAMQETATVTSIRELNSSVPSGFVNQHLEYTHGYGAVQAPISQTGVSSNGNPNFTLQGLPPTSSEPVTNLNAQGAKVYFGEGPDTGGYVIANSKTQELDYENSQTGQQVRTSYSGAGGVDAGSIVRRLAFALRFGDSNFVLSGQITPSSKVMYYRNIVQRVQKAAPFLRFDSDPYSVILNGNVYWIVDAYTISNNYPYAQEASLDGLPQSSGLQTGFNYVRNSVKVVVSAYDGSMKFFDMNTGDPILKVYERAFPDLFTPVKQAEKIFPGITQHWRYPENIFQVQTNMFGRYHLTNPADFYSQAQAWAVSPDPGSGALNSSTPIGSTVIGTNGQPVIQVNRLQPQYIEAALPNTKQPGVDFMLITPFVPISATGSSQNLTAFMTASSDPGTYGQLTLYRLPPGQTVDGPGLISNAIRSNTEISSELTLYDQSGSQVELGEVAVVPIDQTLLYIEPVYVESSSAKIPTLQDVVVVYNDKAYHSKNASLDGALCQIQNPNGSKPFASTYCNTPYAQESQNLPITNPGSNNSNPNSTSTTTTPTTNPSTPGSIPPGATVQSLLAQANQDLANAQQALAQQNLGQYEAYVKAATQAIQQANQLSGGNASTSSTTAPGSTTTTPTTKPAPPTTKG